MKHEVKLLLDSGAYSAFRKQEPITNGEYVEWLLNHEDYLEDCINLDVIPGKPGVKPSIADVEDAASRGFQHWVEANSAGLNAMPVYHMGERRYWLEKMLGSGATYIGLGGVANAGDKVRRPWLDDTFAFLCGNRGYPAVRVHGFGITSNKMMSRYPWSTVDSVTWMKQGVMGSIYVPRWSDELGDYDYELPPYAITVSKAGRKGPSAGALGHASHVDNVGKAVRRYVMRYVIGEGMELATLQTSYKERIRLNARFFKRYAAQRKPKPYHKRRSGLFSAGDTCDGSHCTLSSFRLIYSVGTYLEYANILKEEGINDLLISYHRILYGPKFNLKRFVTSGWFVRKSRKNQEVII